MRFKRSRVRVFLDNGYWSFATRNTCINLESAQRGYWKDEATFQMYPKREEPDGMKGEWKTLTTDTGRTLKKGIGPMFPVRQWVKG